MASPNSDLDPVHVTVFLASPSDTTDARAVARQVLLELPQTPAFRGRVTTEMFSYDDPLAPLPLSANINPQQSVVRYGRRPRDCDLTLIFLWSRMGTPLTEAEAKPDGSRYRSGTEWELDDAVSGGKEVFVYLCDAPPAFEQEGSSRLGAALDLAAEREQYGRLQQFLATFRGRDGAARGGLTTYRDLVGLRQVLAQHMSVVVRRRIEEQQRTIDVQRARQATTRILAWAGGAMSVTAAVVIFNARVHDRPLVRLDPVPYCDLVGPPDNAPAVHLNLTYDVAHNRATDKVYAEIASRPDFGELIVHKQLFAHSDRDQNFYAPWPNSDRPWHGWLRLAVRDAEEELRQISKPVPLNCGPSVP
jgi:hypothetical protein